MRTNPFHEWLINQCDLMSDDYPEVGTRAGLAFGYWHGARDSQHPVAKNPEDLLTILDQLGADATAITEAEAVAAEWNQLQRRK